METAEVREHQGIICLVNTLVDLVMYKFIAGGCDLLGGGVSPSRWPVCGLQGNSKLSLVKIFC